MQKQNLSGEKCMLSAKPIHFCLVVTILTACGSGAAVAQQDVLPLVIEARAIDWDEVFPPVSSGERQNGGLFWLSGLCTNADRWDPDGFSLKISADQIPEGFTIAPVCRVHDKDTFSQPMVGPPLRWNGGQVDTVSSKMAFHTGGWGADGIDIGYALIEAPGVRVVDLQVGLRLATKHWYGFTEFGPTVWTGVGTREFPEFAKVVPGARNFGGAELSFRARVQRRKVPEGEENLLWPIVRKQKVVLPASTPSTLNDVNAGESVSLLDVSAEPIRMSKGLQFGAAQPKEPTSPQEQKQWYFTEISHSIDNTIDSKRLSRNYCL